MAEVIGENKRLPEQNLAKSSARAPKKTGSYWKKQDKRWSG